MTPLGLVHHADPVAEADPAVQLDDGGPLRRPGVAVAHADGDGLLEGEDVLDLRVLAQRVEESLLDGAGVAEQVADAIGDQLLDDGEAAGLGGHVYSDAEEWNPHWRKPFSSTSTIFSPGEVGVRRGAAGDEGVVDDDRRLLAEVADVPAVRAGGIAEDVLERVGRGAHVEVRPHESRAVLVVVFDAVAGDTLAGDDALAILLVPGEGQAGDAIALGGHRLVGLVEAEDQVVDPLVVGQVDDRPAAAHDQDGVVLLGQALADLVELLEVRLLLAQVVVRAPVGPFRQEVGQADRVVEAVGGFEVADLLRHLGAGHAPAEGRIHVIGIHAGRKRHRPLAGRGGEIDLVPGGIEGVERSDQLLTPVAPL